MDYPSYFGGWHSVISGGHVLSVIGFLFFLIMLFDSFYCGKAPKKKTLGVSRLGTRFAFYAYERKKLTLNLNTTTKFNKITTFTKTLTPSKESINYTITLV